MTHKDTSRTVDSGPASDAKLIFLVGAPRSGTTWLQLMLSASPMIATAAETHLFSVYTRSLFLSWKNFHGRNDPTGLHHVMSETEFLTLIREMAIAVVARILAKRPTAKIVLEKTPGHALYWQEILAVFPDACFIHLIRDPRAVVGSLLAASRGWGGYWVKPRVTENSALWVNHVVSGRQIATATPNYLEVRYEDLKRHGTSALQSVFAWCGIHLPDAEVEQIVQEHEINRLRSPEAPKAGGEHGSGLKDFFGIKDFFRRGEIDSWRSDLTPHQVALVEHLTGELMDELGYAREYGSLSVATAAISGRICAGLAWRLEKIKQFEKFTALLNRWG